MDIRDEIYEIIAKYDGSGEIDECVGDIRDYMSNNAEVKEYNIYTDTDVFDSCGLDIFYVSVSWITNNGVLEICGDRLTSC